MMFFETIIEDGTSQKNSEANKEDVNVFLRKAPEGWQKELLLSIREVILTLDVNFEEKVERRRVVYTQNSEMVFGLKMKMEGILVYLPSSLPRDIFLNIPDYVKKNKRYIHFKSVKSFEELSRLFTLIFTDWSKNLFEIRLNRASQEVFKVTNQILKTDFS